MYNPPHFEQSHLPALQQIIQDARLMTLVTYGQGEIEASHFPIVFDPQDGPYGTIRGHLARANPQWQNRADGVQVLGIFTGADCYISPSWYPSKKAHGKVAPTWNYIAVHVYGEIEVFDDPSQVLAVVTDLTNRHEKDLPEPWRVSDAPDDYVQAMLKNIIGFRIRIARLQGKWKLSQNRSAEDQQGVITNLSAHPSQPEQGIGQAMQKNKGWD